MKKIKLEKPTSGSQLVLQTLKELGVEMNDKVNLSTNWMPNTKELKDWLLTKTLINEVNEGEFGVSLVNAKN